MELLGRAVCWVMLVVLFVVMLRDRIRQPGDLHEDDQSKTMAYTVDMIVNRKIAMPRDMFMQPATKPPMYNWLSLPGVILFRSWEPWVFKIPSILAAIATCGLIIVGSRGLLKQGASSGSVSGRVAEMPLAVGIVAASIFIASQPVEKNMYLSRPDMLLTAFLTGAWVFGTLALLKTEGSTKSHAAIFWICIAGAALTKGPPALAVLAYVVIGAPLFAGGLGALRRLHWPMLLYLTLLPIALWMALGYLQNGQNFFHVYFYQEMFSRFTGGGPEGLEGKPWWQTTLWFFQRFAPWSILVIIVTVAIPLRSWYRHVLAPVLMWMLLVLVFFSIPSGKRADYLLPMYAPASIAAAYLLVVVGSSLGMTPVRAMVIVLGVAFYIAAFPERRRLLPSDPTEKFADEIRPIIRKDPMVVVAVSGYQPLLPLLGRFDGVPPTHQDTRPALRAQWMEQLVNARYVVMPVSSRWTAALAVSGEFPGGRDGRIIKMALYRVGAENSPGKNDLRDIYTRGRFSGMTGTTTNASGVRIPRQQRPPGAVLPSDDDSTVDDLNFEQE